MIKNYLVIALRNILRQKNYSFINIAGLATGITCFLLIGLYVYNDLVFDRFHKKIDDIYLVYTNHKTPDGIEKSSASPGPLPSFLENSYGSRIQVACFESNQFTVKAGTNQYESTVAIVNPEFLKMFSFRLMEGNPENALADRYQAIITRETAKKFFGNNDPMGETLTLFNQYQFKITGIMEDIPENSSIRFDILIPYSAMLVFHPEFEKEWWNMGIHTFVTFPASMNPADIEKSLAGITKNNFPDFMQGREELKLMPFKNFHTRKDIRTFLAAPVSSFHLYILLAVAVVILLIACFNFSNLTISRYAERLRETGIRKVIGAGRLQLIFLFLGESVLLAMAGLMIGIILTELLLPGFNMLTGKSLSFRDLNPTVTGTLLVSLGGCVGLMAGVYPAMIFSSFQPIQAIKGEIILRNRRFELRKVLLTLQYIVCFMLMIAVILTQKQIHFMRDHDLGFNPENIMVFGTQDSQAPDEDVRVNSLAGQIRNAGITGIRSVSISENVPGYYFQNQFAGKLHSSAATVYSEMVVTSIDENFLETYGMKLVQGRNFNPDSREDKSNAILINERLASDLGLKEAVGQKIIFKHGEGPYEIIGVVKNIHFQPLQFRIEPLVFRYADAAYRKNFISVSIVPGHTVEIKNFVEGNYKKVFPGNSFNYFFVRDKYDEGYQAESKYAGIIRSFSLVSVFLSLLGLYGLTAVSVNQRKKEIGIRKVFGAGLHNILLLFYREQTLWMVPAFIIACPAGWFLMKRWLQNFPYQTTFNWWIFLLSGLTLFVTAFLTIYLKAARAAGKNPVNIIRYE